MFGCENIVWTAMLARPKGGVKYQSRGGGNFSLAARETAVWDLRDRRQLLEYGPSSLGSLLTSGRIGFVTVASRSRNRTSSSLWGPYSGHCDGNRWRPSVVMSSPALPSFMAKLAEAPRSYTWRPELRNTGVWLCSFLLVWIQATRTWVQKQRCYFVTLGDGQNSFADVVGQTG